MEKDNKNAYSEVIEILKLLDDEKKLEALPIEMLEVLKTKANPEYKPQISKDIPFEEQNLMPETLSILSWIAMKYWNDDIGEMNENENTNGININNTDNVTEINDIEDINYINSTPDINKKEENLLPVLHEEIKWYQKLKEKILAFFNKIFKIGKKEGSTL